MGDGAKKGQARGVKTYTHIHKVTCFFKWSCEGVDIPDVYVVSVSKWRRRFDDLSFVSNIHCRPPFPWHNRNYYNAVIICDLYKRCCHIIRSTRKIIRHKQSTICLTPAIDESSSSTFEIAHNSISIKWNNKLVNHTHRLRYYIQNNTRAQIVPIDAHNIEPLFELVPFFIAI